MSQAARSDSCNLAVSVPEGCRGLSRSMKTIEAASSVLVFTQKTKCDALAAIQDHFVLVAISCGDLD